MAIAVRVGCKIPKNTNLTHPETGHLILGPYSTGAANTTIYTCMAVSVNSAGAATAGASTVKPVGVVITDPTYNWGDTKPGNYVLLPSLIDFYVCAWGACLVAMDTDKTTETLPIGSRAYVYGAGLVSIETGLTSGHAGDFCIGATLDLNAGTTDAADGDLAEIFVDLNNNVVATA